MKTFALTLISFYSALSLAANNCHDNVHRFFSLHAPNTGILTVSGHYTKKSKQTNDYQSCTLTLKHDANRIVPDFTSEGFNPGFGAGGAFWPFGDYPTAEKSSDNYRSLLTYSCEANDEGFQLDYSYRELTGWNKLHRYSLSLIQNSDQSYDFTLRDGDPTLKPVTCRGTVSGK